MSTNDSAGWSRRHVLGTGALLGAGVALGASSPAWSTAPSPGGVGPLRAVELRTELARNPLGVDRVRPRLGWWLTGGGRGARQTAYQIRVATSVDRLQSPHADVWDSGRVPSQQSASITYGGPPLVSRGRYFWTVRTWDGAGNASPWSPPAYWETGLTGRDDWAGTWIGGALDAATELTLDHAHWIWFPEGDPAGGLPAMERYFRLNLDIPADRSIRRARILLTADDAFTLWANGEQQATSAPDELWYTGRVVDLTAALHPGRNTVAVAARNAADSPTGLIARLVVEFDTGPALTVDSGATYRADDTGPQGWQDPGFDDGAWKPAREVVPYGQGPWGRQVSYAQVLKPAPLLRRDFDVRRDIHRARLYVAAAGYHEVHLNGHRVGDQVLAPAPTDYDERVLYVTHDVTELLHPGANAIGAELGRGFFGERVTTAWDWTNATWHGEPRLLAQLEIDYTDGTRQTVTTDPYWRTTEGPTLSDSIYAGETYDARAARPGFSRAGYDDADWQPATELPAPEGTLRAQLLQPIRALDAVAPVRVTAVRAGTYVFDFGRTLGGWASLRVTGRRGTRVTLEYGQQLHDDGTVNLEQGYVHGGRFQRDEYVLSGENTETWQPRFSHKSFRYVQVSGLPTTPSKDLLRGWVVRTDAPVTGRFSCSSDLYNQIHAMVVRSTAHHMLGIPAVDVMYEKIGWTADGQLNVPSFALNFRSHAFLAKWLDDMGDSQREDGLLPVIAPSGGWGYDWRSPEWTAAYPITMWEVYQRFGDRDALARHYDGVRRYVAWCAALADGDGLVDSQTGDWLPPGGSAQPPEDQRLSATAYLLRSIQILVAAAKALDRPEDANRYSQQHDALRDRFNAVFLDRTRAIYRTDSDGGYRQTSNVLALAFDLAPQDLRQRIAESVVADVHERGDHLNTGCLGTAVLLPTLSEAGHHEVAHAIAGQRTFPSWGFWLDQGADTLWETWETTHNGQGRPPSRDHYLFGSVDRWFYEHVAGITPVEPGYRHVRIRPYTDGPLTHASARLETSHGWVAVRWEKRDGRLQLDVDIPSNTTADVHLPSRGDVTEGGRAIASVPGVTALGDGIYRVGAGQYRFVG